MVHSPIATSTATTSTAASLMDVVDVSNSTTYTSIAQDLIDAGGKLYRPEPKFSEAWIITLFSGGVNSPSPGKTKIQTNGSFYELLHLPMALLEDHPGSIEVCINDEFPRWVTTNTTVSSICGGNVSGTGSSATWNAPEVTVPCTPKVPPHPSLGCEAASSYAVPKLNPYVNYVNQITSVGSFP